MCRHRRRARECDWYYWESKPVYAACLYSDVFRRHIMERCEDASAAGMDVVNLDEINTTIGLMDRDPGGSGFCFRCLERFRALYAEVSAMTDDDLRHALHADDQLYKRPVPRGRGLPGDGRLHRGAPRLRSAV